MGNPCGHRILALAAALAVGAGGTARAAFVFTNIVDTNTSAPVGNFTGFYTPTVDAGELAFIAEYNGISNTGMFTSSGGPVTTIVKQGDPAPTGTFTALYDPVISAGKVAFASFYNNNNNSVGIFTSTGGPLTTVVKQGDSTPLGPLSSVGTPVISGGNTVFTASGSNTGILKSNGGTLTTMLQIGDPAPVGTISNIGSPMIRGSTVAVTLYYDSDNESGIFTTTGSGLTPMVKSGDAAPAGTFQSFYDPAISGGTVVFQAYYNTGSSDLGLFTSNGSGTQLIVKQGDAAPVGTFSDFPAYGIFDGTVVFLAEYDFAQDTGIFMERGGVITPILLPGDPLFGDSAYNLRMAPQYAVDEDGEVAFSYDLGSGVSGLALTSVEGVPEPASLALLGCGVGMLAWRRSGGRRTWAA